MGIGFDVLYYCKELRYDRATANIAVEYAILYRAPLLEINKFLIGWRSTL
jgi:hypothetical protein